mmetsp:Transcript_13129/g.41916  ORF Transcript_13129/g.41916 Transcript_13129/m.41916 type:complete len:230 (+) Transcript_13129:207-896(+)
MFALNMTHPLACLFSMCSSGIDWAYWTRCPSCPTSAFYRPPQPPWASHDRLPPLARSSNCVLPLKQTHSMPPWPSLRPPCAQARRAWALFDPLLLRASSKSLRCSDGWDQEGLGACTMFVTVWTARTTPSSASSSGSTSWLAVATSWTRCCARSARWPAWTTRASRGTTEPGSSRFGSSMAAGATRQRLQGRPRAGTGADATWQARRSRSRHSRCPWLRMSRLTARAPA